MDIGAAGRAKDAAVCSTLDSCHCVDPMPRVCDKTLHWLLPLPQTGKQSSQCHQLSRSDCRGPPTAPTDHIGGKVQARHCARGNAGQGEEMGGAWVGNYNAAAQPAREDGPGLASSVGRARHLASRCTCDQHYLLLQAVCLGPPKPVYQKRKSGEISGTN